MTDETPRSSSHDEPIDGEELTDEERRVLANVAGILRKIKYGTVVLVVQDGKVVQIEMAEKFRLR
ncbi:MAG TPA: YezD family protein [Actinomycetota bacterium]